MKLTWLGHSCFKVEKNGFIIITDPYGDDSVPGLMPVRENANMILCSHEHGDHNYRSGVTLQKNPANPFSVETIDTFHDEEQGAKRGRNQIFIIDDGENRIAHLGDLGCMPAPEQREMLKGLDAVLIPVGGYYTIGGSQAAGLVRLIAPRIVIPMHYRNGKIGFDVIDTVENFTKHMDNVTISPDSELETTSIPDTQTVVLRPANRQLSED